MNEKLLGALIGLARACRNNPPTAWADALIAEGLKAPNPALIDAIHAEKAIVAPNCASCAAPCGATADYDLSEMERDPEDVRRAKRRVLVALTAAASSADPALLREGLAAVGDDWGGADGLVALAERLESERRLPE